MAQARRPTREIRPFCTPRTRQAPKANASSARAPGWSTGIAAGATAASGAAVMLWAWAWAAGTAQATAKAPNACASPVPRQGIGKVAAWVWPGRKDPKIRTGGERSPPLPSGRPQMTALLTISYFRRRPAQRISLKAGNWPAGTGSGKGRSKAARPLQCAQLVRPPALAWQVPAQIHPAHMRAAYHSTCDNPRKLRDFLAGLCDFSHQKNRAASAN